MDRGPTIAIPLPYYSKYAYDIRNDTVRGGWLWCGLRFEFDRPQWPSGIRVAIRWAVWWRFKSEWLPHG